jgi:glutathione synthase/RimK-type ligase-like ATP-grasp enzyme
MIRSWNNGWVFCHENVQAPPKVCEVAIQAVESLGLDFGAVDIGFREKEGKAFVFEVNTAPGIEGTTVRHYVEAVRRACNS